MCGNGKSCEECGRGPCGPSNSVKRDPNSLTCEWCAGRGEVLIKATNRGGIFERCKKCYGTGRSDEGRYLDRQADGEHKKKIDAYNEHTERKIKKAKSNIKKWRKELLNVTLSNTKLCDKCKGLGYTIFRHRRGNNPWKHDHVPCDDCDSKGFITISKL